MNYLISYLFYITWCTPNHNCEDNFSSKTTMISLFWTTLPLMLANPIVGNDWQAGFRNRESFIFCMSILSEISMIGYPSCGSSLAPIVLCIISLLLFYPNVRWLEYEYFRMLIYFRPSAILCHHLCKIYICFSSQNILYISFRHLPLFLFVSHVSNCI